MKFVCSHRKCSALLAVLLLGGIYPLFACACRDTQVKAVARLAEVSIETPRAPTVVPLVELAKRDPRALLDLGLERVAKLTDEYHCVFLKQERMNGKLGTRQTIDVRYREEPRAVYMTWLENAGKVKRTLWVEGQNLSIKGEEQALVEPAGRLARLVVDEVKIPIHGDQARKASRYPIDRFGFHATLERLCSDNKRFDELGGMAWEYAGRGSLDGRPTLVLIRHLPYTGPEGAYPDARLVVHIDQEWVVPVAVYSYADENEETLIGSYETTQVKLKPSFARDAFSF
ncbi:MAG: DUF1571 domain-containing protein [Phycisphaerae bacterium]|nr:DUF1571 domain-containing protein [Phycisphaerae bacterium]